MLHCAHRGFHMWLGQNLLFKMAAFTVKCFTKQNNLGTISCSPLFGISKRGGKFIFILTF